MLLEAEAATAARGAMTVLETADGQAEVGAAWASVFATFFASPSVPPTNPGLAAGLLTAQATAAGMLGTATFESGPQVVSDVAALFAAAVALAALGGVAVPPTSPFVPEGSLEGPDEASQAFAASLAAWARTGTFTVPASPPVPWT